MTQGRLGIGVIGTGWVAGAHIDNWRTVPGAEVVAVCSRQREKAQATIAARKLSHASAYDDLDAFLGHSGLDIVCVCTPHAQHPDQTIAAANAGKHVVIEKPVALNRPDLERMVEAVDKAGVLTSVCFELHWIGSFRNTRALIEQGTIGNIFYAEANYYHGIGSDSPQFVWGHHTPERGGGAFLTAGCHAVDAVLHLIDARAVKVTAVSNTSATNPHGYQYDPNAAALIHFDNGAIGKVGVSLECHNPYQFPVVIQGDKGSIVDNRYSALDLPAATGWVHIPCDLPESGDVAHHPFNGQFVAFSECIRHGQRPHNDLRAAAHVHETIFAIDESARQGGTPIDVQPIP